jgi:hypothetical protein
MYSQENLSSNDYGFIYLVWTIYYTSLVHPEHRDTKENQDSSVSVVLDGGLDYRDSIPERDQRMFTTAS